MDDNNTSETKLSSVQLILGEPGSDSRIKVELEPFLEFDIDLTHRLQNLVDRFADEVPRRSAGTPIKRNYRLPRKAR